MGLLQPSEWTAAWIGSSAADSSGGPAPLLRRAFHLRGAVTSARLYATSHGLYELYLNGERVGDWLFTPGWTSYNRRLQYQTYDVTALLRAGDNAIGAILGDGWYRGQLGFSGGRAIYGKQLGVLAQLEVRYADGSSERFVTDSTWKTSSGPIVASDIYGGETYDARLERAGWANSGFDDKAWAPVTRLPTPDSRLLAPESPPVRRVRELRPVAMRRTASGEVIYDLGQNFTGWARLKVHGPAGTTVALRFAEVLDKNGNLYTENLRRAAQTDRYTLKGGGDEVYEPHFTFHGFRYVGVSGLPGADTSTITGVVVSSDLAQVGSFETSDSLLNRLQQNIVWGQRSNFLDVPTDCPQRDERLGWTGDAQVFAPTASFNHDTAAFYTKWLKDVALDQEDDGAVPFVVPNVLSHQTRKGAAASAGWADVAVVVPWTVYQAFGDKRILDEQYPSMKAWVEYMRRQAANRYIWSNGFSFGDWLAFATTDSDYPGATTDKDFIQTAYFARSTALLAKIADVLGRKDDAAQYTALEEKIRTAFVKEFVTANGRLSPNTDRK